jgi:NAD(P)H-flavin reductase
MHHLAALVFIIFLFFHCDFRLSSWDYFIATAILYSLSWCYSQCKTYFEYGIRHKARLQPETKDMLKITVNTTMVNWTAGQHIFLRFLNGGVAHMLSTHPFTVCSVPKSGMVGNTDTLVFYIRPRGGLTKWLMAQATKQPNIEVPILMDGPYGGIPSAQLSFSDQCLVVGGGAGVGFTLSVIEHYIQYYEVTGSATKALKVIIAARELDMRLWYLEALEDLSNRYPRFNNAVPGLSIDIHETGHTGALENIEIRHLDVEKALDSTTAQLHNEDDDIKQNNKTGKDSYSITEKFNVTFFKGRPSLPIAVQQFVAREESITTGLIVCGPSSMSYDVGEAAVSAQQHIIKGEIGAKEVWFHTESFS